MASNILKMVFVVILVFSLMSDGLVLAQHWTYDGPECPEEWPFVFPNSCAEENQSPINIETETTFAANFDKLQTLHYTGVSLGSLLENGHTVQLQLPKNGSTGQPNLPFPAIQGGGLNGIYLLDHIHFHWGDYDSHGSEHYINSIPAAAEIHLVHYNLKYGSQTEAINHPDGLAVLAVMVMPSTEINPTFVPIIKHLREVTHEGDTVLIQEEIHLDDILPQDIQSFYRYSGSLTTPYCNEVVTWTVFSNPTFMSSVQLQQFRTLTNSEGKPLVDNDRPVQPVGRRTVWFQDKFIGRRRQ